MRRVLVLLVGLLVAIPLAPAGRVVAAEGDPPNILIIVTDDQRFEDTAEVMPRTVDWFRGGGTSFINAFATTPLCCPSRANIMTGRYAHNTGVHDNYTFKRLEQRTTIQRYLHDAGYMTAVSGKFFNVWPLVEAPPFFDRWAICAPCGYGGRTFSVDGRLTHPIQRYSTTFIGDRAVGFIEQFEEDDARPWYLYVAPFAPHAPATPSRYFAEASISPWDKTPAATERNRGDKPQFVRDEGVSTEFVSGLRGRQMRSLLSVDEMVASIASTIEALGEDENTLAFFLSDNGMMWHDHGLVGKRYPYTESIQIPFYARWPGRIPEGETTDRLVATIDIVPTILEAVGLQADADRPVDGRPLLQNPQREMLYLEHWSDKFMGFHDWASLRTDTDQYIEYYDSEDRTTPTFYEYYDLLEDPWQLHNLLADGLKATDAEMNLKSVLLKAFAGCAGPTCP